MMLDFLFYVFLLGLFGLALFAGLWLFRSYTAGGRSPMTALFGERPLKRLSVVEHASVDGRRRLILVRRDGVEHLIMTGGPIDVVIETGIGADDGAARTGAETAENDAATTYSRPARTFGRVQRPQEVAE